MQIGELAKKAGVNVQTVRFYERRKLLPEPPRKESGYRVYGEPDLRRLAFIRQAKTLGFSLKEIQEILRMRERGQCPCADVTKIAEKHLRQVGLQIKQLRRFHVELSRWVKTWKRLGKQNITGDAICVLIERTMDGTGERKAG